MFWGRFSKENPMLGHARPPRKNGADEVSPRIADVLSPVDEESRTQPAVRPGKERKKKDERDREGKLRNPRRRQPRRWDRSAHRPPRWSPFYSFVSSSFGSSAPERHRLKQSNSPSEEIAIELKQERERVKGEYKNKFYKKMRRREVNLWWTVNFVDLHVGSLRNFLIMSRKPNRLTAVDRTFYYIRQVRSYW